MSEITPNVVVSMPSQLFTMARSFKACSNGRIYIGKIDTDPTIPENQIQVYLEREDGAHIPAPQPIIINAVGYPVYAGQIAKFVTVQGHSMAIYDSYGVQQFYFPNVLKYDPDQLRLQLESPWGANAIMADDKFTVGDVINYQWKTKSLDYFTHLGGNYIQSAADWCKENGYALVIPRGKEYEYSERVVFEDITLLWEGTLTLTSLIDCGIVFRRNVMMPTYGHLKSSKNIVLPDDYFMVGFYSWRSPNGTLGCQDNVISGRLDIRNGHIDYDGWDQGNVDDYANLTGGGVLMLGGAWMRPTLGVTERSWENVHRNKLNFYIDGFSYSLVMQGIWEAESQDQFNGWVNGNTIDIRARRFKDAIRLLCSSTNPQTTRGGEVSSNIILAELQSTKVTTKRFMYCEGYDNKFTIKGWDINAGNDDILFEFSRGGKSPDVFQESTNNIVELLFSTLNDGESWYSKFVREDLPGANNFIAESFPYKNIFPESSGYALSARGSSHGYIRGVDNFLGNFALRPRFRTRVIKNGSDITSSVENINNMFDGNQSSSTNINVSTSDSVSIEMEMISSIYNFTLIGQTLSYISALKGKVKLEALDSNGKVIYSTYEDLRSTNVTGIRLMVRVYTLKVTYYDFESPSILKIGCIFAKCDSHNTRMGVVGSSGGDVSGHVRFLTKNSSPVIMDQVTGQFWEIIVEKGVLNTRAYNP
ncbi:phage head-binding domain-containing protein [Xenorhabdus anantnagensis]|uniref:Phage head-binding domain-containing protein n=1 Tax=Xenorhabdus anantnagensis TaxID=3025875 RepID=A0ABT5LV67_9GAMM|nr:phage head-binding domain-containing protein [Xenorhabdus anantnagensis]MDC9598312.1 phage head-binding domain-containing protein [Xenorhabdus anantnagensis]